MIPTKAVVDIATTLKQQGFFDRVKQGDEKAASLFARLVAYQANPNAHPERWGWLAKTGSGFNIDGWADGAIVYGNDPSDRQNVVKIVTQIGTSHADIGDAVQERRESDQWRAPHALSLVEMRYLKADYDPSQPVPGPVPVQTAPVLSYEDLGGDAGGVTISRLLEADYKRAGMRGLDGGCGVWLRRVDYDVLRPDAGRLTLEQSIKKHREEWCQTLGINAD